MFAVWILVSLLGGLIIVLLVALSRLFEFQRIQSSIEQAWYLHDVDGHSPDIHVRQGLDPSFWDADADGTDFQPGLARQLLDCIARVTNEEVDQPPSGGFVLVETLDPPFGGPPFGYVWMRNGADMVIAFRSSITSHEICDDLRTWQVDYDTGDKVMALKNSLETDSAYVHAGFFDTFQRYRVKLQDIVTKHAPTRLFLGGHSLGGCIATISAVYLGERLSQPPQIIGYVFGTPRVGNRVFRDRVGSCKAIRGLWRVANETDMIQEMPPFVTPNFKHPDRAPYYYEHAGKPHIFSNNFGTWMNNHMLPTYIKYIDSL